MRVRAGAQGQGIGYMQGQWLQYFTLPHASRPDPGWFQGVHGVHVWNPGKMSKKGNLTWRLSLESRDSMWNPGSVQAQSRSHLKTVIYQDWAWIPGNEHGVHMESWSHWIKGRKHKTSTWTPGIPHGFQVKLTDSRSHLKHPSWRFYINYVPKLLCLPERCQVQSLSECAWNVKLREVWRKFGSEYVQGKCGI